MLPSILKDLCRTSAYSLSNVLFLLRENVVFSEQMGVNK